MKKRSKRYGAAAEKVKGAGRAEVSEAVKLLKSLPVTRFDETVSVAFKLGIDPKKSDQIVRGSFNLPHGIGKERKVIVFAEGKDAEAAKQAGAVESGGLELVKKVQDGWLDFDVAISTPDMMRHVGKLGKILGPAGKMPSPKSGTVTPNVAVAVNEYRAGKVEFRNDVDGNLHIPVGRKSFAQEALTENVEALIEHVKGMRPATAKGTFIQRITVSSTMSPSVELVVK
jgi:large subunit ribosomal protein L1